MEQLVMTTALWIKPGKVYQKKKTKYKEKNRFNVIKAVVNGGISKV